MKTNIILHNIIIILLNISINLLYKNYLYIIFIPLYILTTYKLINIHINSNYKEIRQFKIYGFNNNMLSNKYIIKYIPCIIINLILILINITNIYLFLLNILLLLIIKINIYLSLESLPLSKLIKIE